MRRYRRAVEASRVSRCVWQGEGSILQQLLSLDHRELVDSNYVIRGTSLGVLRQLLSNDLGADEATSCTTEIAVYQTITSIRSPHVVFGTKWSYVIGHKSLY